VLLLARKIFHPVPKQEIVPHAVKVHASADIVFELAFEFAGGVASEKTKTVVGPPGKSLPFSVFTAKKVVFAG